MAMSKSHRLDYEIGREKIQTTKMKTKKINKKMREAFLKLNRKDCYNFFDDPDSKSYQNALDFFTLVEKKCEELYGKKKKYKKSEIQDMLENVFCDISQRGARTMQVLNKLLKKTKDRELLAFPFKGIMKTEEFHVPRNKDVIYEPITAEESIERYRKGEY